MARKFSVETVFEAVDRITGPIKRMTGSVDRFVNRSNRAIRSLNTGMGRMVTRAKQMALVGGAAFAGTAVVLAKMGRTGAEFEDTLVSAAAKFPGLVRRGTEAYTRLQEVAERMGRTTEFSASQAADGLNFLAMAGFNANQSISALPGVIDLATVAQLDLGMASDIATDTLGSFNLMTEDTIQLQKNLTRVNDVLARTVTTSNTNVEQFFEAMKQSGAAAAGAGADIETYASGVGFLATSGIKASQAGTTLKRMFLQLAAPTGEAARTLRRFNISVSETIDGKREMRDIIDVFSDLERALDGLGSADRAQALRNIFGLIPIAGVNTILERGVEKWRQYRDIVRDNEGASRKMAFTMRNTVMKHFIALTSAIEGLQIALFNLERDAIDNAINAATLWVRTLVEVIEINETLARSTLRDLISTVKNVILAFAAFIAIVIILKTTLVILQIVLVSLEIAIAAVASAFWLATGAAKVWLHVMGFSVVQQGLALIRIFGVLLFNALRTLAISVIRAVLIPAFAALWAVMMANPIIAILSLITLLVGAGIWLYKNWDIVKEKLAAIWESIKSVFMDPIEAIEARYDRFIDSVMSKVEKLKEFGRKISSPFSDAKESIDRLGDGIDKISQKVKQNVAMKTQINDLINSLISPELAFELPIVRSSMLDTLMSGERARSLAGAGEFALGARPIDRPGMVSPGDRTEAATRDGMSKSFAEIVLRAESGTSAEVRKSSGPLKPRIVSAESGGF